MKRSVKQRAIAIVDALFRAGIRIHIDLAEPIIEKALKAERKRLKNQWLSGETAPKNGQQFIAYDPMCGLLFSMHYDNGKFLTNYEWWSGRFTHWMPLPKRPNER